MNGDARRPRERTMLVEAEDDGAPELAERYALPHSPFSLTVLLTGTRHGAHSGWPMT